MKHFHVHSAAILLLTLTLLAAGGNSTYAMKRGYISLTGGSEMLLDGSAAEPVRMAGLEMGFGVRFSHWFQAGTAVGGFAALTGTRAAVLRTTVQMRATWLDREKYDSGVLFDAGYNLVAPYAVAGTFINPKTLRVGKDSAMHVPEGPVLRLTVFASKKFKRFGAVEIGVSGALTRRFDGGFIREGGVLTEYGIPSADGSGYDKGKGGRPWLPAVGLRLGFRF